MAPKQKDKTDMKHTPSPWIVDDRHVHRKDGLTYPPDSPVNRNAMLETDLICEVNTDCHPNGLLTDIDKANLKLIAAAPDLLEACQRLLAAEEWSTPAERMDAREKAALLRAAINKASV